MKIGVISDTHGLLRKEVLRELTGVDRIIHAGDLGTAEILPALESVAPCHCVRGNVDHGHWAESIPHSDSFWLDTVGIHMVHDLMDLDMDPKAAEVSVVIHGHTHKPAAETKDSILYLNPGSIGPRRFKLPISMAYLHIDNGKFEHEFVDLSLKCR